MTVAEFYRGRTGRELNLARPRGMNEIIQWLKVNDRRPEQVTCCDKLAVRGWVEAIAGPDILVPLLDWPPREFPCVAKCTHDSGSRVMLSGPKDIPGADRWLRKRLKRRYGADKGEWAYAEVVPRIMVERRLPDPLDFKVHCADGEVRFVQVVHDITGAAREAVFLPDGTVTALRTNTKFAHDPALDPREGWDVVMALSRKLAAGWRYVRVDLMWSSGRPWFSELTFWPRSGIFYDRDERALGDLLGLDLC